MEQETHSLLPAGLAATATTAVYLIGAGRAFGYDSAVTMHNFVRTDSLGDALTRQVVFNNHPLFSLLEHVIYSITGSVSEVTMRVAPALFAGLAVGVVKWWAGQRWGTVAGLSAAAVMAANPIVVSTAREVRGYSLLLLATVLYLVALTGPARATRKQLVVCSVAVAVGIGTHIYMVMPVLIGTTWLILEGRFDRRWRVATGLGVVIGSCFYLGMLQSFGRAGRVFRPEFPRDLAWALLGGSAVAVVLSTALAGLAAYHLRRSDQLRNALIISGEVVLMVLAVWLIAPTDLYPRFFLWLTPAVAIAVAWAVHSIPWGAVVVAVAAVGALVPQLNAWATDPLPTRSIARALASTEDVCGTGWPFEAYQFYDPGARAVAPSNLDGCDALVVILPEAVPAVVKQAALLMPFRCHYGRDGLILVRSGMACPS